MAARGPKPAPPELKLVRGNPGHRPIPRPPKQKPGLPPEPVWSDVFPGTDGESRRQRLDAAEAWLHIVPLLDAQGIVSPAHLETLRDYAVCVAQLHDAVRQISRDGAVIEGQLGLRGHPITPFLNQCRSQFRHYIAELGLSPSSAGRLPAAGGSNDEAQANWG